MDTNNPTVKIEFTNEQWQKLVAISKYSPSLTELMLEVAYDNLH